MFNKITFNSADTSTWPQLLLNGQPFVEFANLTTHAKYGDGLSWPGVRGRELIIYGSGFIVSLDENGDNVGIISKQADEDKKWAEGQLYPFEFIGSKGNLNMAAFNWGEALANGETLNPAELEGGEEPNEGPEVPLTHFGALEQRAEEIADILSEAGYISVGNLINNERTWVYGGAEGSTEPELLPNSNSEGGRLVPNVPPTDLINEFTKINTVLGAGEKGEVIEGPIGEPIGEPFKKITTTIVPDGTFNIIGLQVDKLNQGLKSEALVFEFLDIKAVRDPQSKNESVYYLTGEEFTFRKNNMITPFGQPWEFSYDGTTHSIKAEDLTFDGQNTTTIPILIDGVPTDVRFEVWWREPVAAPIVTVPIVTVPIGGEPTEEPIKDDSNTNFEPSGSEIRLKEILSILEPHGYSVVQDKETNEPVWEVPAVGPEAVPKFIGLDVTVMVSPNDLMNEFNKLVSTLDLSKEEPGEEEPKEKDGTILDEIKDIEAQLTGHPYLYNFDTNRAMGMMIGQELATMDMLLRKRAELKISIINVELSLEYGYDHINQRSDLMLNKTQSQEMQSLIDQKVEFENFLNTTQEEKNPIKDVELENAPTTGRAMETFVKNLNEKMSVAYQKANELESLINKQRDILKKANSFSDDFAARKENIQVISEDIETKRKAEVEELTEKLDTEYSKGVVINERMSEKVLDIDTRKLELDSAGAGFAEDSEYKYLKERTDRMMLEIDSVKSTRVVDVKVEKKSILEEVKVVKQVIARNPIQTKEEVLEKEAGGTISTWTQVEVVENAGQLGPDGQPAFLGGAWVIVQIPQQQINEELGKKYQMLKILNEGQVGTMMNYFLYSQDMNNIHVEDGKGLVSTTIGVEWSATGGIISTSDLEEAGMTMAFRDVLSDLGKIKFIEKLRPNFEDDLKVDLGTNLGQDWVGVVEGIKATPAGTTLEEVFDPSNAYQNQSTEGNNTGEILGEE